MKKLFFYLFLLLGCSYTNVSFSQLPNQNTYLLRNLDIAGRSYSACWGYTAPNGREYAILGYNRGTAYIDITDSANIQEVDTIAGVTSTWREMKTYSHYAYIVSEGTNSRLQIVDLQYLPDSVSLVTTWSYTGYGNTHSISQSGPYLYLNGGNASPNGGVAVVDITNPIAPVKRGQWTTRYVHDCRVINDTIWAANISNQRVSVINAINKDNLQEITNWINNPSPAPHNCDRTRDGKYMLVTDENTSPGKLKVWNIQDLTNILFVTTWQPTNITTSIVHNVEIYGDYAILAHYTSGIRIVNISNPALPTEVAWYDTYPLNNNTNYSGCWGVYKFPSGKIIGSDISNGLFVIKTTIPMKGIIKLIPEGFYDAVAKKLRLSDSVKVYLHNSNSPFNKLDSAESILNDSTFTGEFIFKNAPDGNYYISVKHRNSIETWSNTTVNLIRPGTVTYDFTAAAEQAFGSNMKQVDNSPVRFGIYSGDVNQDGIVDASDLSAVDNDAFNSISGYVATDVNGDNFVDASDLSIVDNNAFNSVIVVKP